MLLFKKDRRSDGYVNIFTNIYKNKQSPAERFINFWKEKLPQLVYETCQVFLVFMDAFLIGTLSTVMTINFSRVILGNSYVDMTIEHIKKGNPMIVYKDGSTVKTIGG